jgi:hypothetical protein
VANELTIFNTADLVMPDYLKDFLADEDNIVARSGVPTLAPAGNGAWATTINGEKTTFMRRNADGDEEPVGVLRVIVLAFAPKRGRTYYEGDYNPETAKRPDCWSADGDTPDASVENPPAVTCANCPMSVKGSKINAMGKEEAACKVHRLVAVVPAGNLDHAPMRMKLSVTSDFDGMSPDLDKAGWFAFRNYTDYLRTRQITHTSKVVTKIKFDPNKTWAKIIFSPEKFIDPAQAARIAELVRSDEVKALVTEAWTPNGADGTRTSEEPAPAQKNARVERPKVIEGEVAEPFITPAMKEEAKAPAKAKAAAKPKAVAPKPPVEDNDDDAFAPAPVAAVPAKVEVAAAPTASAAGAVPDDVADLLSAWGG